jgi:SAM-dependent methyltransferase
MEWAANHRTQPWRAGTTGLGEDGRSHDGSYGDLVYDRVRESYDRVAERYAEEIGGELAGKPVDRALLRSLAELSATVEEVTGPGSVADLGCGPGHIASYLSALGVSTVGIDFSPAMIEVGRRRYPQVQFRAGSLLTLPVIDGEMTGAIAFYSFVHLRPPDRSLAFAEMRRAIRPGGWLLLAFHVNLAGHDSGEIMHVEEWWGERVDLDTYFMEPTEVAAALVAAGFVVMARTDREPWPGVELASRRCYLLCQRP